MKKWPENVFLVTGRPHGLTDPQVKRLGLDQARIDDLPSELQRLLARRWFRIQKRDARKGDATADALVRDIGEHNLRELAQNPLMLTAMCALYSDPGAKLPQDRHKLYEHIVERVLIKPYPGSKRRDRARFDLGAIAHAMHDGEVLGVRYPEPRVQAVAGGPRGRV